MTQKSKFFVIIAALLFSVVLAVLCDFHFRASSSWSIPVDDFQQTLWQKEQRAEAVLLQMEQQISQNCLPLQLAETSDIVYLVSEGDSLLFWSDNRLDISNLAIQKLALDGPSLCIANNAYCVVHARRAGDKAFFAFILLKNRSEASNNSFVALTFARDFDLDSRLEISFGEPTDKLAIFDADGNYLFSLSAEDNSLNIKWLASFATFFYALAFLLLLLAAFCLNWFFGEHFWSLRNFVIVSVVLSAMVVASLLLGLPSLVFESDLFSPIYYASHFFSSFGNLLIVSALTLFLTITFSVRVLLPICRNRNAKVWWRFVVFQAFSGLTLLLFCVLLSHLSADSSFAVVFYRVDQLSLFGFLSVLLAFAWLLTVVLLRLKLFRSFRYVVSWRVILLADSLLALIVALVFSLVESHTMPFIEFFGCLVLCVVADLLRLRAKRFMHFVSLLILTFVGGLFAAIELFTFSHTFKQQKFALVAENLAISTVNQIDIFMHRTLSEIDLSLQTDETLLRLLNFSEPSFSQVQRHLNNNYFSWSAGDSPTNFDAKIFLTDAKSPAAHHFDGKIAEGLLQPFTEHFYLAHLQNGSRQFVGIFDFLLDNGLIKRLFVQLSKSTDQDDFDALFQPASRLDFALSKAVYKSGKKVYNSGFHIYPNTFDSQKMTPNRVLFSRNLAHFVYQFADDTMVVISERHLPIVPAFMLFWTYFLLIFLLLILVVQLIRYVAFRRKMVRNSLTNRILRAIVLLVLFVVVIGLVVTVLFWYNRQKTTLQHTLASKTYGIESQVQSFFWNESADSLDLAELDFFMQDLSRLYRTDIHLYDVSGTLLVTTRPHLFSSGLCGKQMNPQIFFDPPERQKIVQEFIGELTYFSAYATINRRDGRPMAFICVPMFYSSFSLTRELFTFLAIFIDIYLLVILLAALIGAFLGKRLFRPLKTLENHLRQLKLGRSNEKIDFHASGTDEIDLLVSEYNKMVDKLAESAAQLAQSERETAWRGMARQIAHEIKNPLTPMKLTIQQLQRAKTLGGEQFDDYFAKASKTLVEQIDSLSFIASEFSNFARMPLANPVLVDLCEKLQYETELFRHNYENVAISFRSDVSQAWVLADNEQLTRLFNNLLKNAIQAIPSTRKGEIRVAIEMAENRAVVTISDNGCGISPEAAEHIFVPNFTTKSSGMGLGLCIVKNIVAMCHADISFTTEIDRGTTFSVRFPLQTPPKC